MDPNDKIVLHYFPLNARAFASRCMLEITNTPYTNKVITPEDWAKLENKDKIYEFSFLPMLEYNDISMSQSRAIESFLAKRLGFLGSNDIEEYEINSWIASGEDLFKPLAGLIFYGDKMPKEKYESDMKEYQDVILPWIFGIYENRFTKRKGQYLVGNKLSAADIYASYVHEVLTNKFRNGIFDQAVSKYAPTFFNFAGNLRNNELKVFFEGPNFYNSPM